MWKSSGRRTAAFPFAKREVHENDQSSRTATQETSFVRRNKPSPCHLSPVDDNRLKCKFEAIDVLLQILLHQDELTLKEYTINDKNKSPCY